jgi:long-chain fatty acid adenylyltransferase FadD28
LLIVYGRNHYPEDIEATIQEISGGRCAAISVSEGHIEKLVAIVEVKKKGDSDEEAMARLNTVKGDITSAISKSHGLRVADLVLVGPGAIPITTSGKIRRSTCVEHYQGDQFADWTLKVRLGREIHGGQRISFHSLLADFLISASRLGPTMRKQPPAAAS